MSRNEAEEAVSVVSFIQVFRL